MVTIITEKLRNQRLDDIKFEPISQNPPRKPLDSSSIGAVKSDRDDSDRALGLPWGDSFWRRRHASYPQNVLSERAQIADGIQGLPSSASEVPPLKRHCRSLSVLGDQHQSDSPWQPQAGSIWRPVRTRKSLRSSPLCGMSGSSSAKPKPVPRTWSSLSEPTDPETHSPVPRPSSASSGFCSQGSLWTSDNSPAGPPPASPWPSTAASEDPCAHPHSAVSMPTLPHHHVRSTPSSPRRQRVPRCRSQPSVLTDRKGGLKRRREECRPTLDFLKMKETALENCEVRSSRSHSFTCGSSSKPQRNVQFAPLQGKNRGLVSWFTEPPECALGLNTIASSPLDPGPVLDAAPKTFVGAGLHRFSDSGCSNDDEEFLDASADNPMQAEDEEPAAEEQFDLEMNNDLDLEQIEKD